MDKDLRIICNRARSRKGVTLVELVVCMALTSIFAIVCIGLINPIERMYSYSQDTGRAQLLADSIVDSLRQECENAMLDGETSVWIASRSDFGSLDDSVLIDEALNNKANEGDVLVFKRNAGFCEALYSCFPVTTQARDEIVNGEGGANRSVAALFDSEDSVKRGIVHLGYYKSAYQDDYPVPSERYDYTNPIPAAAYSDFTVALTFRNMEYAESATGSKIPAFVVCDIYIFKGEYSDVKADCVYSRSTALCFTVNGSGEGIPSNIGNILPSGGDTTSPNGDILLNVEFLGNKPLPASVEVGLFINGARQPAVTIDRFTDRKGFYSFADVELYSTAPDGELVNNIINGWAAPVTDYGITSTVVEDNEITITFEPINGVLVSGETFNSRLGEAKNNIKTITFGKASDYDFDESDDWTQVSTDAFDSYGGYRLYIKGDDAYVLSQSGTFKANANCHNMFINCVTLEKIVGMENVNFRSTNTVDHMFKNCQVMENFDFPYLVSSSVTNMGTMFDRCYNAQHFDFTGWDTSNVTVMEYVFNNAHSVARGSDSVNGTTFTVDSIGATNPITIDVSEFDFSSCTNMQYMFGCDFNTRHRFLRENMETIDSSVTTIILPADIDTSKVTNMEGLFADRYGLTNIVNIDKLDSDKLDNCKYFFENCNALPASVLKMPGFIGPTCKKMSYMYLGCTGLSDYTFDEGWDTSGVTEMKGMFENSDLRTLNLTGLNVSKVQVIEDMFRGCNYLNSVEMSCIDFADLVNCKNMFRDCPNLTVLDLHEIKLPKLNNNALKEMFGESSIKELNLSKAELTGLTSFDSLFKNKTTLVTVDLSKVVTGRENMSTQYMFSGCSNLERVVISNVEFKSSNAREMFSGCKKLEDLVVDGLIGKECTSMYRMFYNCAKLPSISFGDCDVSKVTSMKEMCSGCTSLVSLDMSRCGCTQDKSIAVDMSLIAKDCTSLKTFKAENLALSNLYQAFYNCQNLSNLSLSQIDASACTNLSQAFYNCYDLTSFDFESVFTKSGDKVDLKQVKTIAQMFQNCTSLRNIGMKNVYFEELLYFREIFSGCHGFTTLDLTGIHMPAACKEIKQFLTNDSVNTLILDNAVLELDSLKEQFKGNNQLVTFRMNNATLANCTSVQGLFQNCSNLNTVEITNTNLGECETCESMFQNCKKLESISMNNFQTPACTNMNNMFRECNSVRGNIVLSGWDTRRVATMEYMFYDFGTNMSNNRTTTENVTLDISSFSFESVTSCKEMFCVNGKSENGLRFIYDYLTLVILPESANAVNLTTMYRMFSFRINLKEIRNMGGFITSNNLINTTSTFANCRSVTTIDISSMNLSGVKESKWMFNTNANTVNVLTTIYVSDDPAHAFNSSILSSGNSSNMFENSMSLVGGNGTVFDSSKLDRTYARIDGLNKLPGYFSVKPAA